MNLMPSDNYTDVIVLASSVATSSVTHTSTIPFPCRVHNLTLEEVMHLPLALHAGVALFE